MIFAGLFSITLLPDTEVTDIRIVFFLFLLPSSFPVTLKK